MADGESVWWCGCQDDSNTSGLWEPVNEQMESVWWCGCQDGSNTSGLWEPVNGSQSGGVGVRMAATHQDCGSL